MSEKPKLENLNVLSNFLMNAIANDPDICEPFFRLIISILLEIEIGRIIVRAQNYIPGSTPELRGIQLDVEITEYLDDGLKFIYFNAKGNLNTQKAKKELLTYLNSSKIENVTNDDIVQLHNYVSSVKQSAEVQGKFMTMGEWMDAYAAEYAAEVAEAAAAEAMERGMAQGLERGLSQGLSQGERIGLCKALTNVLAELGTIPEEFETRLQDIDEDTLKKWTKLAARVDSMEEFFEQIN